MAREASLQLTSRVEAGTDRGGEDVVLGFKLEVPLTTGVQTPGLDDRFLLNFLTYFLAALVTRTLEALQVTPGDTEGLEPGDEPEYEAEGVYADGTHVFTGESETYQSCVVLPYDRLLELLRALTDQHDDWVLRRRYNSQDWTWVLEGELAREGNAE